MFHGFDYPDETEPAKFYARFWEPKMVNGVIKFKHPKDCAVRKFVRPMKANPPDSDGLVEADLLEGCEEGRA